MTYTPSALYAHGFTDLVSVLPPGAVLAPTSKIAPSSAGKAPGRRLPNGLWVGYHWQAAQHTADDVARWLTDGANVGLRADRFPAVDIDCTDAALSKVIADTALGVLGKAPERVGKAPKRLLQYRTAEPFGRLRLFIRRGDDTHLVEVLGQGQQYVVFGTHPATQQPYAWNVPLDKLHAEMLTPVTLADIEKFFTEVTVVLEMLGYTVTREGTGRPALRVHGDQDGLVAPSIDVLRDAVAVIPNRNTQFATREEYIKFGYAIRAACGDEVDEGFHIFADWAGRWEDGTNDPEVVATDWRRFRPPFSVGWPWLAELARAWGYDTASTEFAAEDPPAKEDEDQPAPPRGSDQDLAVRVAEDTRGVLRYVPQRGSYLCWDGARWRVDAELLAEDAIKQSLRRIAVSRLREGATAKEKKEAESEARDICSAARASAVGKMVRSERSVAVSIDALDHDPWALNTPAGIVDLRTLEVAPVSPDALCTKTTAVPPAFGVTPTRWLQFLEEATGGDTALIAYLQRLAGYCCTGSTREQQLTFVWGPGGNGKSVFLNVLSGILGDYAAVASMDTFTASNTEKHSTDIAMLAGARLVTASETQAGKRWDEAKVKALTGGEPVSARFMRQDNFTFRPQFKLLFVGNHKPEIRDIDAAMRRRIQMVPFTVTPKVPDLDLAETLRQEWPAILAWMLEGCRAWGQQGLTPPASVQAATEEYFADEDAVGRWLQECATLAPEAVSFTKDLFASWREWANQNGEYVGSEKRLADKLVARKLERWRDPKTRRRGFAGLSLTVQDFGA